MNTDETHIELADLESRLSTFFDIKKKLLYYKTGGWGWCDKSDEEEGSSECFPTAWEAILDATAPYFDEDSDE